MLEVKIVFAGHLVYSIQWLLQAKSPLDLPRYFDILDRYSQAHTAVYFHHIEK